MISDEKQRLKIRTLFEKNQTAKAITSTTQLLKSKSSGEAGAAALKICNEFQQYDFVIHGLKKRLKSETNILIDLELYADTLGLKHSDKNTAQPEDLKWLVNYINKILPGVNTASGLVANLAIKMGYARSSHRNVVSSLLDYFLSPLIKYFLNKDLYSDALMLESMAYEVYVKQEESENSFSYFMSLFSEDMQVAGQKLLKSSHLPIKAPSPITENAKKNIAFVIHHSSTLAHISSMLAFFEGLQGVENNQINPVVFSFSGKDPEMLERCHKLNVKVVLLSESSHDLVNKVVLLKQRIAAENCRTAVWLCLTNWMDFCFSYRIADVQIWWSMKYHDYSSKDIDGYLCRFIVDETFYHGEWRGGFLATQKLFDSSKSANAIEIREKYANKIILGTIGRAELINDSRFLESIIQLLKSNPNTIYVWTGREQEENIVETFKRAGVLEQTDYVGWVDTKLYAQVLDIFLDVFSFGTGFTLVEAMAAGKAVVFLDEARDFSVLNVIRGLIASGYLKLTAEEELLFNEVIAVNPAEYIEMSLKLINDASLRKDIGKLLAELATVFENKVLSAEIYHQHINEIVRNSLENNNDNLCGVKK